METSSLLVSLNKRWSIVKHISPHRLMIPKLFSHSCTSLRVVSETLGEQKYLRDRRSRCNYLLTSFSLRNWLFIVTDGAQLVARNAASYPSPQNLDFGELKVS